MHKNNNNNINAPMLSYLESHPMSYHLLSLEKKKESLSRVELRNGKH